MFVLRVKEECNDNTNNKNMNNNNVRYINA